MNKIFVDDGYIDNMLKGAGTRILNVTGKPIIGVRLNLLIVILILSTNFILSGIIAYFVINSKVSNYVTLENDDLPVCASTLPVNRLLTDCEIKIFSCTLFMDTSDIINNLPNNLSSFAGVINRLNPVIVIDITKSSIEAFHGDPIQNITTFAIQSAIANEIVDELALLSNTNQVTFNKADQTYSGVITNNLDLYLDLCKLENTLNTFDSINQTNCSLNDMSIFNGMIYDLDSTIFPSQNTEFFCGGSQQVEDDYRTVFLLYFVFILGMLGFFWKIATMIFTVINSNRTMSADQIAFSTVISAICCGGTAIQVKHDKHDTLNASQSNLNEMDDYKVNIN